MISLYAQSNKYTVPIKYGIYAPDGSVAITIIDDSNDDLMKLESVDSFYKYQLLDMRTSQPIFSSLNIGTKCTIDKTKVVDGTYKLRLFTKNFIITSKVTLTTSPAISTINTMVAMND